MAFGITHNEIIQDDIFVVDSKKINWIFKQHASTVLFLVSFWDTQNGCNISTKHYYGQFGYGKDLLDH